jgi:hypothetical protein
MDREEEQAELVPQAQVSVFGRTYALTVSLSKKYPSEVIFIELFLQKVFMRFDCSGFATVGKDV